MDKIKIFLKFISSYSLPILLAMVIGILIWKSRTARLLGGGRVPHASAGVREFLVKFLCQRIAWKNRGRGKRDRRQNRMKPGGILFGNDNVAGLLAEELFRFVHCCREVAPLHLMPNGVPANEKNVDMRLGGKGNKKIMLKPLLETRGYGLRSIDKDLGGVEDYYFDDRLWTLRYLVADTGNWLPGRTVLIGMESVGEPEWEDQVIPITLTSAQIEDSPGIERDLPFSLQKERELRLFFQWREYWNEEIFIQRTGDRPLETENPKEPGNSSSMSGEAKLPKFHGNPHLRSANEIQEYTVRAHNEEVGYMEDFLIWVPSWEIRYVVIDTRNWLSREKILISPRWITSLDWSLQAIDVDISREKIEKSPGFTPGEPITSDYETTLHHYYGQPQDKER